MTTENKDQRFQFRCPSSDLDRLEAIAKEAGCSTSEAMRRLVAQAEVLHEPQIIVRRR